MAPRSTLVWTLLHAPQDAVREDAFALSRVDLPGLQDGDVLLQMIYLSNDPAQRAWIQKDGDESRSYTRPIREGDVMHAYGIAKVIESKSSKYQVGQLIRASMGWRQYHVMSEHAVMPVPQIPGLSPTVALGALGGPALTAYFALYDICHVTPEQVVLVSGAAGATGSAAIQIAKKIIGAKRVIGIAGGPRKCAYVREIGADECLDYKAPGFKEALHKATEGFVDAYLDLVGGDILDATLSRMKRYGHIAAIGSISTYNDPKRPSITNWHEVIQNSLTIHGFIIADYANRYPAAIKVLAQAIQAGIIDVEGGETVCEVPFDNVPQVWRGLFTGANQGKLITKVTNP